MTSRPRISFGSLTVKLWAIYVPLVCISFLAAFGFLELEVYRSERAKLVESLKSMQTLQSSAFASAAWEYDTDQIATLLAQMEQIPQLLGVEVVDENGELLGQIGDIDVEPESPDLRRSQQLAFTQGETSHDVGQLIVTFHSGEIWQQMQRDVLISGLILAMTAIVLLGATLFAVRVVIGRPVSRLMTSIERRHVDGTPQHVDWKSRDELGRVVEAYNDMQAKEAAAENARRRAEDEARDRLDELTFMNRRASTAEFVSTLAHEIKQPLAAIGTNASAGLRWISRGQPDLEETKQALTRIGRDVERASDVIDSIRTMFRKDESERSSQSVNQLIEDTLPLVQSELRRRKIVARTALTNERTYTQINKVQIQQVLLNLIMNSIESMGNVTNRDRVLTVRSVVDGSDVTVTVKDTGSGIDPEEDEKVFEPLFTTKKQGFGMGLSICRSIIIAHGGKLSVQSTNRDGAAFRFSLPMQGVGDAA